MKEKLESLEWKPELPDDSRAFIPKGWRNSTLRWFGFTLQELKVDHEIIEFIIRRAAMEICIPPFTEKQLGRLIEGVFKEPSIDMMEK